MKEQKTIVAEFRKISQSKKSAALATVVRVRGSSYRSPGARMLITDDGRWVGSISGGCLEGDALRKARQVMQTGQAILVTYDTREESNQNLGIGLGCNGVIDVLIESVSGSNENTVSVFEKIISLNVPVALATVATGEQIGKKVLIGPDLEEIQSNISSALSRFIHNDIVTLFDTHKSEVKNYDGTEVFIELIQPSISLIIFGGGFDARPVSQLAKSLGWSVAVTDECVAHIAPVFFPGVDKLSLCEREFIDREISVDQFTACILMSHNYEYDRDVLKKLIQTETPYIGILGPRKRFDKMLDDLGKGGSSISSDQLRKIHSPIGLDIGAETPDEIAVSIIAEIQSKFFNRSGGFLKYRSGPIHQRESGSDQVYKQAWLGDAPSTPSKSANH